MPKFRIQAPDGRVLLYDVPDGVTAAQALAHAQQTYEPAPSAPQMTQPTRKTPAVPVMTRAQEIQQIAKKEVDAREKMGLMPTSLGRFDNAMQAGLGRMLLGLPERIGAALDYYTPMGNRYGAKSYDDQLAIERAITDEMRSRSTAGNIAGTLSGAVASGAAEAGLLKAGAAKLASSGIPAVAKIGNILSELNTFRSGQIVRNAAKLALSGATGGAAQAAGEGSDIKQGAEYGAGGALALGAGGKLIQSGSKIVRSLVRPASKDIGKALQEVITEAPATIAARQAALEAKTGAPVPTAAALNDQDFGNLANNVLKNSPEASDIAKGQTGQYIRGFMDRMLQHVNNAGAAGNATQVSGIGDLAQVRKDTADALMAPIRDKTIDMTQLPLDDLERQVTKQIGGRIAGLGPRLNKALQDIDPKALEGFDLSGMDLAAAKKLLNDWGLGQPIHATVGEMDALRRTLDAAGRASMNSNPANSLAFRNAAKTIGEHVGNEFPQYKAMIDTYAAHSRMLEGFDAASQGQRPADITDDTLRANLESPEGRVGMKAGELYRLRQAATSKPTSAISLARDLASEGGLTRPASLAPDAANPGTVTENLGDRPAADLANAAQGETAVLDRMVDANKVNAMAANEEGTLSPEELVYGAFLGHALPATKARFLSGLIDKLPRGFNPEVANNMADMLFSGDPAKSQQVINALQKTGISKQILGGLLQDAGAIGAGAGAVSADANAPGAPPAPAPADNQVPELDLGDQAPAQPQSNYLPKIVAPAGVKQYADDGSPLVAIDTSDPTHPIPQYGTPDQPDAFKVDPNRPYGRQVVESLFPGAKITDDVRDPNSKLGKENPNSDHVKTQNAVDLEPIDGMSFNDFLGRLHDNGHQILEAIDEVNHPSKYATGPHWHVVIN